MVRVTMSGKKTQTRITKGLENINKMIGCYELLRTEMNPTEIVIYDKLRGRVPKSWRGFVAIFRNTKTGTFKVVRCPYGQPGDLLWVRETWTDKYPPAVYYKASCTEDPFVKWRSSSHLPKKLARTWLQVQEIRLARIHDITDKDAIEEGIESCICSGQEWYLDYRFNIFSNARPYFSFRSLWIKNYGEENWYTNPWVWVVKYKIVPAPYWYSGM